jgi:hypothetical protein
MPNALVHQRLRNNDAPQSTEGKTDLKRFDWEMHAANPKYE